MNVFLIPALLDIAETITNILQLSGLCRDNMDEPLTEETFTTHTYRGHQSSLICFLHLLHSMASAFFNLRAWQSFSQSLSKFSLVNLLVWHPPLHTPYTSSPNHSFRSTCSYHLNLFCCSTEIMSSNPTLSLNHLLGTQEGSCVCVVCVCFQVKFFSCAET